MKQKFNSQFNYILGQLKKKYIYIIIYLMLENSKVIRQSIKTSKRNIMNEKKEKFKNKI